MYQAIMTEVVKFLASAMILFVANELRIYRPKVMGWIDSHTTQNQRAMLHVLATEAAALGETAWKDLDGNQKLQGAMGLVQQRLKEYGLQFDEDAVRAAIEAAYLNQSRQKAA